MHNIVYGAVIMAEPLRELTRFVWWMSNGNELCQSLHPPSPFISSIAGAAYRMDVCRQTFSNRYSSYSFCPILAKFGTHDLCAKTVEQIFALLS